MISTFANRPTRRLLAWVAVVTAGASLVAACGSDSTSAADDVPVEEQLGLESAGIIQRQAKAESLIRDCMKTKGFEYVPVDPVAQQADLVGQTGLSDEDFAAQYGYGLTTLYEQRKRLGGGPNAAYRASLAPTDQAAYDRTLYGDDVSATFSVALDTGDYSRLGGCTKDATNAVFGGIDILQSLQDKLDELDGRIAADPRMTDAIAKWSACMRDAGFDLPEPDQVDVVLLAKLEAIVGPPGNETADYDKAALAALQKEEVTMVAADMKCEEQHISPVEEKVRAEYERTFREENADLLSKVPPP